MQGQQEDSGAVIGYEPVLSYRKANNTAGSNIQIREQDTSSDDSNIQLSQTLQCFTESTPSETLQALEDVPVKIRKLTDALASMFNTGNWGMYNEISMLVTALNNGDTSYAKDFVDYHYNGISGSIIPELIWGMHEAGWRVKIVSDTLKELYYGRADITLGEASALDSRHVSLLKSLEVSGDIAKINYPVLAYDAMVNHSTMLYAFEMNKAVSRKADTAGMHVSTSVSSSGQPSVLRLFEETNGELSYRKDAYSMHQDKELLRNALYNYYRYRRTMDDMANLFYGSQSVPLGRKLLSKQGAVKESVMELNRLYAGSRVYMYETTRLEQEKNYLKNIYNAASYK